MLGFCGSIAMPLNPSENHASAPKPPVFSRVQLTPPSALLNTPPSRTPASGQVARYNAYMVLGLCGSIARLEIISWPLPSCGSPAFTAVQFAPASVVLNTPTGVPAYMVPGFCGSIFKTVRPVGVGREYTAIQFAPASVVLNTPV